MSKTTEYLLLAWKKGYRATPRGEVISPYGKVLSLKEDKQGYNTFSIKDGGKVRVIRVHRLVGYQKYGSCILEAGVQVRHLDSNQKNNQAENIAWGSASQNQMDRSEIERIAHAKHAASFRRCLTEEQVAEIREKYVSGEWKYKDIVEEFGIAKSTVSYLINHKTY